MDYKAIWNLPLITFSDGSSMTVGLLVRALADPAHRTASEAVEQLHTAMHQAWVEEIRGRVERSLDGETEPLDWKDVIERLEAKYAS